MSNKQQENGIPAKTKNPLGFLYFIIILFLSFILLNKTSDLSLSFFQTFSYLLFFCTVLILIYHHTFNSFSINTVRILYIISGMTLLFIYVISFYPVMEINGDNAAYLAHAKSMIEGHGFRNLWMPNEAYDATLKSIGFSILNIPFILVFGVSNAIGIQLLPQLSVFGGLFFMYLFFKDKLNRAALILLVGVVAVHSQIIHFASITMTESSAFFFIFLIFFLTEKFIDNNSPLTIKKILLVIAIAFLAFFSFTVREAMIVIPGTVGLFLLLRKRWKEAVIFIIVIAGLFAAYFSYSNHLKNLNLTLGLIEANTNSASKMSFLEIYADYLITGLKTVKLHSFSDSILVITQKIVGNPDRTAYSSNIFLNIIVFLTMIAAFFKRSLDNRKIGIPIIFFVSLILVIIYSWGDTVDYMVFSRYYYPLIPFVFYFFIKGVQFLADAAGNKLKLAESGKKNLISWIFILIFGLILILEFTMNTETVKAARDPFQPPVKDYVNACTWIKMNTPPDAIIADRKSTLSYIWANRKSIHFYDNDMFNRYNLFDATFDSKKFEESTMAYYRKNHVKYIIIDSFLSEGYNRIVPVIQKNMKNFVLIYSRAGNTQSYPTMIVKTTNL